LCGSLADAILISWMLGFDALDSDEVEIHRRETVAKLVQQIRHYLAVDLRRHGVSVFTVVE
jgi:hypothetical protein